MEDAALIKAEDLLASRWQASHRRADRFMAGLLLAEWLSLVVVALTISPLAWAWDQGHTHLHVVVALVLGGLTCSLPVILAWRIPGAKITRHVMAVAQMLVAGLFIHLTGGRIESHFLIFASLAILSLYRDWAIFIPATLVVLVDRVLSPKEPISKPGDPVEFLNHCPN